MNRKRPSSGFVMLNESSDIAITASTPLLTEPERNFFHASVTDIPESLPAYMGIQNEVDKKMALFTTENNVFFKKRREHEGTQ